MNLTNIALYRRLSRVLCLAGLAAVAGCGGNEPPPKTADAPKDEGPRREPGPQGPVVEQELGSIDPRAVEQTFDRLLNGKLESCHQQGRGRIDYLSGEAKVFLRVGKDGRVKYALLDESTIGDRDTEKCVLDTLAATDWPKPIGGEAEVRSSFSWTAGGERQPAAWGPDKVASALASDKGTAGAVEKCKAGVSGTFRLTAYVEPGEVEHASAPSDGGAADAKKADPKKKGDAKKGDVKKGEHGHEKGEHGAEKGEHGAEKGEHGGKFKSLGVAAPGKEGAEKIDCIVDAMKGLSLPSPGSYAAKVTFTL
jgi:hypothetical protein